MTERANVETVNIRGGVMMMHVKFTVGDDPDVTKNEICTGGGNGIFVISPDNTTYPIPCGLTGKYVGIIGNAMNISVCYFGAVGKVIAPVTSNCSNTTYRG